MNRRAVLFPGWARRRAVVQLAVGALSWAVALIFATGARFDFELGAVDHIGLLGTIPLAVVLQLGTGLALGLHVGGWRFASFDEVAGLARRVAVSTAILFAFNLPLSPRPVPKSSVLGAGFIALVLTAGARYAWRLRLEGQRRPTGADSTRLLVFGAGEGGAQVITAMLRDPDSPYFPVGLLDDDPEKRNIRISGIPVVGTRRSIRRAAEELRADALLIAIPSAGAQLVTELSDLAANADLAVKVLPPVRALFGTGAGLADIRDVDVEDLLGRQKVDTDVASIAGYLTGKRVLVTGAGGSIGSELCRQISNFSPAELVMLDRNEAGLHSVQLSLDGRALLDSPNLVLADVRDAEWVQRVFERHRPQVVFHAAALKHLPLLEQGDGSPSPTGGKPLVHDGGGGHRASDPGRRHRSRRRGAGAGHGATGPDRRCRPRPNGPIYRGRPRSSSLACGRARSSTRFWSAPARWTSGRFTLRFPTSPCRHLNFFNMNSFDGVGLPRLRARRWPICVHTHDNHIRFANGKGKV